MKAYKAFNADLTCRGFRYEIGKTYTMNEKPKLCERGFHAYKNLDDIFYYRTPVNKIRICEVELDGIIIADIDNNNDKYVSNKITILKEIDYSIFKVTSEKPYHRMMVIHYGNNQDLETLINDDHYYVYKIAKAKLSQLRNTN